MIQAQDLERKGSEGCARAQGAVPPAAERAGVAGLTAITMVRRGAHQRQLGRMLESKFKS